MVIAITFNLPHCACGWGALAECPGWALNERAGLVQHPSSMSRPDPLLPTAKAPHTNTAVPHQVYGFLEASHHWYKSLIEYGLHTSA